MDITCDKCGSQTTPKQITSRKDGKIYTVYECCGSCMNGKYKYSRFAPRPSTTPVIPDKSEVIERLKAIELKVDTLLSRTSTEIGSEPKDVEPDYFQ